MSEPVAPQNEPARRAQQRRSFMRAHSEAIQSNDMHLQPPHTHEVSSVVGKRNATATVKPPSQPCTSLSLEKTTIAPHDVGSTTSICETLIWEREGAATCHPVNGQSNIQVVKFW